MCQGSGKPCQIGRVQVSRTRPLASISWSNGTRQISPGRQAREIIRHGQCIRVCLHVDFHDEGGHNMAASEGTKKTT